MLATTIVTLSVSNGSLVIDDRVEASLSVSQLDEYVEALVQRPDLASLDDEVEGDRGFFTIQKGTHVLHAYFVAEDDVVGDRRVRIELFPTRQIADSQDKPDVIVGFVSVNCLKELVRRLDSDESPGEFAAANVQSLLND